MLWVENHQIGMLSMKVQTICVHTVLIYLMASVCAWYLTLNSCCCRWKRLSDYMIKEGSAV